MAHVLFSLIWHLEGASYRRDDDRIPIVFWDVVVLAEDSHEEIGTSFMASASTTHVTEFSVCAELGATIAHGKGGGACMVTEYLLPFSKLSSSLTVSKTAFKIGLFEPPAPQKMIWRVCWFRTGKVNDMREGGGLGESSKDDTHLDVSWSIG